MIIASCKLKIQFHAIHSLKEKRRSLKSLLKRLPREFNVATAEVDHHDVWQTATIGIVSVGTDSGHLHSLLESVIAWIELHRPDAVIENIETEMI